jgi:hypothetical protein
MPQDPHTSAFVMSMLLAGAFALAMISTGLAAEGDDAKAFDAAAAGEWGEVFADDGRGDWREKWFLDGEVGTVTTGPDGMTLSGGPTWGNDAHHIVLWTKPSFQGDLKLEYDYTRLDNERRGVTIIYLQATGSGEGPYAADLSKWNDRRRVPAMRVYFDHLNTYHISYAAFDNAGDSDQQYIRARRYMPHKTGLAGSDLEPDYYPKGLFAKGVKHTITIIKKERDLYVRIRNPEQTYYCHMTNAKLPPVLEGRVGLRHMFTRSARYERFSISQPKSGQ